VKYEDVYLRAYAWGSEARRSLTGASASTMANAFTSLSAMPRLTKCTSASGTRLSPTQAAA
jgi:hypothetical protein